MEQVIGENQIIGEELCEQRRRKAEEEKKAREKVMGVSIDKSAIGTENLMEC